jgi:uncharacterized Zn finger protein
MCKHVAAALYGVGARLDEKPELLFVLRDVDENELLAGSVGDVPLTTAAQGAANVLDDSDVVALFGLEMAETIAAGAQTQTVPKQRRRSKISAGGKMAGRKTSRKNDPPRGARSKSQAKQAPRVSAGKTSARPRRST